MGKRVLIKNVIAGALYLGAALFIVFIIGMFVFNSGAYIDISGLMIIVLIFCCPVVIATFLLVTNAQGVDKRLRIMKKFVIFVFIFYAIVLISLLFLNGRRQFSGGSYTMDILQYLHVNANFIPFKTIGNYIQAFYSGALNKSTVIINIVGNILVFAPMGILLPIIFRKLRNFKTYLITILAMLISVEILQLASHTGRGDIDDVILNLFGAVLFYGIWRLNVMQKILKKIYIIK